MLKIERQKIIETELQNTGFVLVPSMSELLHCSEETVRRDLKEMETDGRLVRTHGGAFIPEKYDKSYPTELKKTLFRQTKESMAAVAMRHINNNDMVMLDSSTTCLALAKEMIRSGMDLTIITNALHICELCNETDNNIKLVCAGGTFRKQTMAFTDSSTVSSLRRYCADISFISPAKISREMGLADNILSESLVRQTMLEQSQKRCLIADHTKFEGNANILFEGLDRLDILITDQKLDEEWEKYLIDKNIKTEYC